MKQLGELARKIASAEQLALQRTNDRQILKQKHNTQQVQNNLNWKRQTEDKTELAWKKITNAEQQRIKQLIENAKQTNKC